MNANAFHRVDPRSIPPLRRTYLRARHTPREERTPRVVAAVVALCCGALMLLLL